MMARLRRRETWSEIVLLVDVGREVEAVMWREGALWGRKFVCARNDGKNSGRKAGIG